jgi:hypothetical protein
MADRANKTTPPCDWYITMSKDLCYAAVMDGRQMDRWSVRIVYDSTKGYSGPVYFCPLDLAYFVRLLK